MHASACRVLLHPHTWVSTAIVLIHGELLVMMIPTVLRVLSETTWILWLVLLGQITRVMLSHIGWSGCERAWCRNFFSDCGRLALNLLLLCLPVQPVLLLLLALDLVVVVRYSVDVKSLRFALTIQLWLLLVISHQSALFVLSRGYGATRQAAWLLPIKGRMDIVDVRLLRHSIGVGPKVVC